MNQPDIWFEREYIPVENINLVQTNMYIGEDLTGTAVRIAGADDRDDQSPISPDVLGSLIDQTIPKERKQRIRGVIGATAWTGALGASSFLAIKEALDVSNSTWVTAAATAGGMVTAVAAGGGMAGIIGAATGKGFLHRRAGVPFSYLKQLKAGNRQYFFDVNRIQGSQPPSSSDTL